MRAAWSRRVGGGQSEPAWVFGLGQGRCEKRKKKKVEVEPSLQLQSLTVRQKDFGVERSEGMKEWRSEGGGAGEAMFL